ncbi:MAG: peptidylprolyl isomerase [Campylobacterales bacterium]|nr:peptidylprolyl isomerase [Campylobacterales bacterium]
MFGKSLKEFDTSAEALEGVNFATITTEKGAMKIKLLKEEAPIAVANFADLAKKGFYDGLNFHRVIAGFMAQGGCPEGSGRGGPGYAIKCECMNNTSKHLKGTLSMAHAGRDTGGSQFFICFAPQPHLDKQHTVFGQIDLDDAESMKTLDSIKQTDKIVSVTISAE